MTTIEKRDRRYVEALCRRYRRWGAWGADDERGALNFITPEVLVRTGRIVSCALPFDEQSPHSGRFGGRHNPMHIMVQDGGDIAFGAQDHLNELRFTEDAVAMPLHCGTHWNALAHIFHQRRMYGGHGVEYVTSKGAARNGIEKVADGIAGRGVLLDMPGYFGVEWMQPGQAITSEDLAGAAREQAVEVGSGDIVLIRTGHIAKARAEGTWGSYEAGDAPGLGVDSVHWICENEVAAVCADTGEAEVRPNDTDEVFQPLQLILLVNAGIQLGGIFDLENLARVCAEESRYEFLFVAPPSPLIGAVASPAHPLAFF
ncbi:cyclase family protein [Amycolatopsis ultiminotia]|uniref:Cyclase family protein n=1 Tax=Amycolatopsis ultiminotia TaxID=543629 RepID=A0ABP6VZP7_9PSEU